MNCLQLISRSLRMLRVLGAQREPSAAQAATGLEALQSLVLSLPGATWWRDVTISAAYTAGENERIFAQSGGPFTISGPQLTSGGHPILFCCDTYYVACSGADDRPIKDGARVQMLDADANALTQMYRADMQVWLPASGLTLTSTVPVNADMEDGLAAMLAVRLADDFGRDIKAATATLAIKTTSRMRARYGQRLGVAVDEVLLCTSNRRFNDGYSTQ